MMAEMRADNEGADAAVSQNLTQKGVASRWIA
jgi:hypothetical protein